MSKSSPKRLPPSRRPVPKGKRFKEKALMRAVSTIWDFRRRDPKHIKTAIYNRNK